MYYNYYATQVLHHWGGRHWEKWNERMRSRLVSTQTKSGHGAGSWNTNYCQWAREAGCMSRAFRFSRWKFTTGIFRSIKKNPPGTAARSPLKPLLAFGIYRR